MNDDLGDEYLIEKCCVIRNLIRVERGNAGCPREPWRIVLANVDVKQNT